MKKSTIWVVTSLCLILTLVTSSVKAEVIDPLKLKYTSEGMTKDGLVPKAWLLINEITLRELDKDVHAKSIAEESLKLAQNNIEELVKALNESNRFKWEVDQQFYKLQTRNYDLENPVWYKSSVFWGVAGFSLGFVATIVGGVVIGHYVR